MKKNGKNSLEIRFGSERFVAGDSVTGEIIVNSSEQGCKLNFSSSGTEKILITHSSLPQKSSSTSIYSVTKDIKNSTESFSESFPFSLKIPAYAPSTFSFDQTLADGTHINAEIQYEISVVLSKSSQELQKISKNFIVFSRKSIQTFENHSETLKTLTSCICIPRGDVNLSVSERNSEDILAEDLYKFKANINSTMNKHLISLVGQIILEFSAKLSDQNVINYQKIVARTVPNVQNLKNMNADVNFLTIDMDIPINTDEICGNVCSADGATLSCTFKLQVLTVYEIGWRSKLVDQELVFHVNPNVPRSEDILEGNGWGNNDSQIVYVDAGNSNSHLYLTVAIPN